MSQLFISYARGDKPRVDDLTSRLRRFGYDVWLDDILRGGQSWWEEIGRQIRGSDGFVPVVSHASLRSQACQRELDYAGSLGKPVLPIAIEKLTQAMPSELSTLHVVDYSAPGEDAAFELAAALRDLSPAPPLPEPLPSLPPVPLSYLTDLVDRTRAPELTKGDQRQILDELETGLRSADEDERTGARQILETMKARDDLFADIAGRIEALEAVTSPKPPRAARDRGSRPRSEPRGEVAKPKRSKLVTVLAIIGGIVLVLLLLGLFAEPEDATDCFIDAFGNEICQ